ncbi:hypothetical protein BJX61DRAFT_498129 [Aspergillus egyptiacus]|nr:hypothetical protein BJX61DRAFT_498129 [Aspergillus egyptiacus]
MLHGTAKVDLQVYLVVVVVVCLCVSKSMAREKRLVHERVLPQNAPSDRTNPGMGVGADQGKY